MSHWQGNVVLVVDHPRHPGDGAPRNDLLYKHHPAPHLALNLAPNIEPEVHLQEVVVEGNRHTHEPRIQKPEPDDADEAAFVPEIEHGASGHIRPQKVWIDLVVEESEIAPFGGQEGAFRHGGS